MPNVLIAPVSGAIFFDTTLAGSSAVAALSSSVRLSYDQGGAVNITSYATAATALNRLTVDGAQGRLFTVTDSLTGSLMSVNNIAGLPILEVLDTPAVVAGPFNTNTFVLSGTQLGLGINPTNTTSRLTISGDMSVFGNISAIGTVNATSISSRYLDLVHLPANDGTNPVLRIGEYDTTGGNAGFSGIYISYDETTNAFGISAQFAPTVLPAINIDRNAVVGARTIVAGPAFDSFSTTTPISAVSGVYVDPVSGYAGFYTNVPVAPVDIRGSTKIIGFSAFGNTPSCLRMKDDYLYVLCNTNSTLNVFDTSTSVPQFVASAATLPLGTMSTMAIQGKYAYVTTTSGMQSFDISAITPVSAGNVSTQQYFSSQYNQPSQIMIQGRYAYFTHYTSNYPGTNNFSIVDISDPTKLSHLLFPTSSLFGGSANFTIQGNNMYYGYSYVGGNFLYQANLAATPVPTPFSNFTAIQNGTFGIPISIAAQGRYVYIAGPSAFYVIDTTKTGTSRIVATLTLDNMYVSAYSDMVIQRQYAYVMRTSGIYVINISNPRNPVIVQRIAISTSSGSYRGMVVKGRYLYFTDGTNSYIYRVDLGGSYIQQLEAGGIHTEHLYSSNVYAANEVAAIGGGSFGNGLNVQGAANVQGSLSVTPASGTQTVFSNYFSVVSSNPATTSTVFAVTNTNRVGIGTASPGATLTVVGDISAAGIIYAPESNSSQWNSNYTTTNSNSANWSSAYTSFNTNSAKYDSSFTTTSANSANWNTAYRSVSSQPYTIVNATSSIVTARGLNTASGLYSVAAGGKCNTASGCYSYIAAGCCNTNCSPFGFIAGGCCNITSGLSSIFVLGSNITALSANTTYINNMCTSNSIYGTGNQTVLSDGIGANVNGNGPQTLSINYTNGLFVGCCAYVSGNLSVCGSLADYNGNPLVPYTSTSSSVNCGCNSITTATACGNSILAYSSCCLGNSNILGGCCNTICSCGCMSNNGTAGRSYIQNSNIYSGCKNSIFNGTNSYCYAGYYSNYFDQSTSCMLNNSIMGGNCNCIKDYYLYSTSSTTSSLYNTIINGVSGCIVDFSSCFNTIVNGTCNRLCNGSSYSAILGGCCNCISGNYVNNSVIVGGVCNYTPHCCVFILGSNITSSCNNFTYVNNLSSNGLVFGKLGTANVVAGNASTQAGCKVQIFNGAGASLGYIQVYSA